MKCSNPKYIKILVKPYILKVGCGKCTGCRVDRAAMWANRLMDELNYWSKASFITLTYDDEHLPKDRLLIKSDLQKFFKRLRKGIDYKIKYYACGEYGENNGRPHYHAILFGIGSGQRDLISQAWNMGRTQSGTVTHASCRYVADYISKVDGALALKTWGPDKNKWPFKVQSNGIGSKYVEDNLEKIEQMRYSETKNGIQIPICGYYRKKAGLVMNNEDMKYLDSIDDENRKKLKDNNVDYFDKLKNDAMHLDSRMNMKKKGKL